MHFDGIHRIDLLTGPIQTEKSCRRWKEENGPDFPLAMAFECEVLGGIDGFEVLHGASAFDGTDVVTLLITEACHTSRLPLQRRLGCHLHRPRIA